MIYAKVYYFVNAVRSLMESTIVICIFTCLIMILGVLFFPKIKLGAFEADSYWVVTLLGALVLILAGEADVEALGESLIADNAINPLKILTLFICMTLLSIFLDELGFFAYLASAVLRRTHIGQRRLFFALYAIVSLLTVFTSNDIIILSFTPFICHFAKNAHIDPKPYLAAEFVAANTLSMALIIGNPTNIYLATAYDIQFLSYLKISALPTALAGIVAYLALYLLFRRKLQKPIEGDATVVKLKDKPLLIIGIIHLAVCTILLAISSYIGVEMWIISIATCASLLICVAIAALVRKQKPVAMIGAVKRVPYQLVPFMLSMFVLVEALASKGVTENIAVLLGGGNTTILKYGLTSALSANLINNIPMSVLFSSVISCLGGSTAAQAMFATVVGSNIGAFLTPIGALAGIMFSKIASSHGVTYSYADFLKVGAAVAVPTLLAALGGLYAMLI